MGDNDKSSTAVALGVARGILLAVGIMILVAAGLYFGWRALGL